MSDRGGNARAYIEDMLEYAGHIERFILGKTEQDFLHDVILQFAVIRALEVLGEAAKLFRNAVPDAELRFPWIPFQEVYATRNRLIHGYASTDPALVWRIASQEITPLREGLERCLINWPADLT
jgi:uncharacterized protein with HEPN domain